MFSGFKSMIFGYTEPTLETDNSSTTNEAAASLQGISNESSTPSILLEQTLNAATTKFTEQLLPQQASIEQLQSSSHQLLPSLTEQQELVKYQRDTFEAKIDVYGSNDGAEDDDELIADSWELLDLVEKRFSDQIVDDLDDDIQIINNDLDENDGLLKSSSEQLCKSSSGILKSTNGSSKKSQAQDSQQARQKPKVSFETPDLVKGNHRIDRTNEPKQGRSKNGKSKGCNKTKKNKQATGKAKSVAKIVSESETIHDVDPRPFPSLSEPTEMATKPPSPQLSYAAAISAKKKKDSIATVIVPIEGKAELDMSKIEDDSRKSKAIKRHRYDSTSSFHHQTKNLASDKAPNVSLDHNEINDDNESIMSSGFSDCDYEYKGVDDYIMRPKKTISKRGRNKSSNLSQKFKRSTATTTNNSAPASTGSNTINIKDSIEVKSVIVSPTSDHLAVSESHKSSSVCIKASKSKRKRNLETSAGVQSSVDFLKPTVGQKLSTSTNIGDNNTSNDSSDIAEMDESWYVTPPPCFTGTNKLERSPQTKEASIENELIEHPSIYIASTSAASKNLNLSGSSRVVAKPQSDCSSSKAFKPKPIVLKKVKSQEHSGQRVADRKMVQDFFGSGEAICDLDNFWATEYDEPEKKDEGLFTKLACKKSKNRQQPNETRFKPQKESAEARAKVAPKKVANQQKSASNNTNLQNKPLAPSGSGSSLASMSALKQADKSSIAWRNKFIVDDWNLDDQEDPTSDFDDMFEPVRKKKATNKSKRKQQQHYRSSEMSEIKFDDANEATQVASSNDDPQQGSTGAGIDGASGGIATIGNQKEGELVALVEPIAGSPLELEDISAILEASKENQRFDLEDVSSVELQPQVVRKSATQVQPIGPERKPGWQLKRQRSKRRSLASSGSSPASGKSNTPVSKENQQQQQRSKSSSPTCSFNSTPSSARSTPTLIDRIGSSIVANLNNLTSGFVAVNPMLIQASGRLDARSTGLIMMTGEQRQPPAVVHGDGHHGPHVQAQRQALAGRASKLAALGESRANQLVARKQVTKGFLRRQNGIAANQSSQRRADRRLRMFARPNGCSINRKVQTNY